MSGNVGTNGGKGGIGMFLLVIAALALGVGFAFYLKSGPSETDQAATAGTAVESTISNGSEPSNLPQGTVVNEGAEAVQVQGSVALIATDDPSYLSCIERPLDQGETRDQRITACNEQLQAQQAGTASPTP